MKKTYIVDIDDTILDTINGDFHNSTPLVGRIEKINRLYREGHHIIYWTARDKYTGESWYDFTKKQLNHFGCLYHELRTDKPNYDIWIDDKAINSEEFFKAT